MDVDATVEDQLAIVRVRGYLDTKSSPDFERKILELLQGGARAFAIDFTKLDMITSAGIRILMMAIKRLGGADRVALWGLNEQVKVVFQIAGLAGVFRVVDSQQAAVEHLKKPAPAAEAEAVQASKMTRLITRLLGDSNQTPARRQAGAVSKMTEHVSELLKSPKS
jgi:anti-anti-sigma factor